MSEKEMFDEIIRLSREVGYYRGVLEAIANHMCCNDAVAAEEALKRFDEPGPSKS